MIGFKHLIHLYTILFTSLYPYVLILVNVIIKSSTTMPITGLMDIEMYYTRNFFQENVFTSYYLFANFELFNTDRENLMNPAKIYCSFVTF